MRLIGELGLQVRIFASAAARPGRIATLGHEPVDHTMERRAVVEVFVAQQLDALDMQRRQIGAEPNNHPATLHVHVDGVLRVHCRL